MSGLRTNLLFEKPPPSGNPPFDFPNIRQGIEKIPRKYQKNTPQNTSRGIPNFLAPTPSCGRPLPHRKISGLKSLGLGSFFVPEYDSRIFVAFREVSGGIQESPRQTKPKKGAKRKVHEFRPFFCERILVCLKLFPWENKHDSHLELLFRNAPAKSS